MRYFHVYQTLWLSLQQKRMKLRCFCQQIWPGKQPVHCTALWKGLANWLDPGHINCTKLLTIQLYCTIKKHSCNYFQLISTRCFFKLVEIKRWENNLSIELEKQKKLFIFLSMQQTLIHMEGGYFISSEYKSDT